MSKVYCYEIVKENLITGEQGKKEIYYSNHPIKVGGLYMHLRDLKGAYRILRQLEPETEK